MIAHKQGKAICGAILVACILVLGGCATSEQPDKTTISNEVIEQAQAQHTVTFTDDLGKEVTVTNPERVVACMGSFADMWRLAGGLLVGASSDSFADYDIDGKTTASVGDFSSPDMESIIACDPDFVIMTCAAGGRGGTNAQIDMRETLEASGITTAYFDVKTFDDYMRVFNILCDITQRDDLREKNGTQVAEKINAVITENKIPEDKSVTAVVLTTYSQGIRVQNSQTMTGTMLADLGVHNIADDNPSILKDFSIESLIELDPDMIYVIAMGNDAKASKVNLEAVTVDNPAWSTLRAVKTGRAVMLDPVYFMHKPNENWATSYSILAMSLRGL